jgi:hypothetical protein
MDIVSKWLIIMTDKNNNLFYPKFIIWAVLFYGILCHKVIIVDGLDIKDTFVHAMIGIFASLWFLIQLLLIVAISIYYHFIPGDGVALFLLLELPVCWDYILHLKW